MRLPFQSQPKTLAGRVEALGGQVIERADAAREDALEFLRGLPARLDSSRKRALAVAGGAAGAAAGFAFWRSRHEDTPPVDQDPARPSAPWKMPPPDEAEPAPDEGAAKKPVTDSKAAAANATGSRSK